MAKKQIENKNNKYLMHANWLKEKKLKADKDVENVNQIIQVISV